MEYYTSPQIVAAVPADDPNNGVPSDHCTVFAAPLASNTDSKVNEYIAKTTRPMPDSAIRQFGKWIVLHSWDNVKKVGDPTQQVTVMQSDIEKKVNEVCPTKVVKFSSKDKKKCVNLLPLTLNNRWLNSI